jgi:hypothetical protein
VLRACSPQRDIIPRAAPVTEQPTRRSPGRVEAASSRFFYPQMSQINADFLGRLFGSLARWSFFYPQITPINADFWRRVSHRRCAALPSHAAGFFADWGRLTQIF